MRLLHVVPTYLPAIRYGGPIVAVHGLCRALAARGHSVAVFTTSIDGPRNSAVPHGAPVMLDGVTVRYFASDILRRLSWAPALAGALRQAMTATDIVHLHSVFLWPTWVGARLARQSQVPYVMSPRGMLVETLIKRRHRWLKTAWINLIEQSNLENAAAVHVTSAVEAAALSQFGFRLRRVVTLPNGIAEAEPMAACEAAEDVTALARMQPLILFLGRITWVKGLDRLLRAFARTRVGGLAIVGNDYDNIVPQLSQLARELNIADRVCFVPRTVTGAEKEFVFAAACGLVLPSHSESFGNSALEAMQRGLPVIVAADVGVADAVRESGGGIVVEGQPEQLGEAIERITKHPTLGRAMGEAARRYVEQRFSWDRIAAAMEELYENLQM